MEIIDLRGRLLAHEDPERRYVARARAPTVAIIHHTATGPEATPQGIATYHVEGRGYPGIAYHYLIDARGVIYQVNDDALVTWHAGCAAVHGDDCPYNANTTSLGVCFIGTFMDAPPTPEALAAGRWLLGGKRAEYGLREVIPHRAAHGARTACPGDAFPLEALAVAGIDVVPLRWNAEEAVRGLEGVQAALADVHRRLVDIVIPGLYTIERGG